MFKVITSMEELMMLIAYLKPNFIEGNETTVTFTFAKTVWMFLRRCVVTTANR